MNQDEISFEIKLHRDMKPVGESLEKLTYYMIGRIEELETSKQDSISKSKLLEWLKEKRVEFIEGLYTDHQEAIEQVMQEIQSGSFDQGGEEE